jgi:hypothetical protein
MFKGVIQLSRRTLISVSDMFDKIEFILKISHSFTFTILVSHKLRQEMKNRPVKAQQG